MTSKIKTNFEAADMTAARQKIRDEVDNWSWVTRERKDAIVEAATIEQRNSRYGPIFFAIYESS